MLIFWTHNPSNRKYSIKHIAGHCHLASLPKLYVYSLCPVRRRASRHISSVGDLFTNASLRKARNCSPYISAKPFFSNAYNWFWIILCLDCVHRPVWNKIKSNYVKAKCFRTALPGGQLSSYFTHIFRVGGINIVSATFFLRALASSCLSVCLCVRMEQLGSH